MFAETVLFVWEQGMILIFGLCEAIEFRRCDLVAMLPSWLDPRIDMNSFSSRCFALGNILKVRTFPERVGPLNSCCQMSLLMNGI